MTVLPARPASSSPPSNTAEQAGQSSCTRACVREKRGRGMRGCGWRRASSPAQHTGGPPEGHRPRLAAAMAAAAAAKQATSQPQSAHLELLHRDAAHPAADVGAGQRQRGAVLPAHGADEGRVRDAHADGRHPGVELGGQRRAGPPREQQRDGPGQQVFQQALGQVLRGAEGQAGEAVFVERAAAAERRSHGSTMQCMPSASTAPCARQGPHALLQQPTRVLTPPTSVSPNRATSAMSATAMASGLWSPRCLVA